MGNVVQGLNNDGENSQLFLGNYHNVGSTVSNFTSGNVNFAGTGQSIDFKGTGQTVTFGSGVKVTYNNQPVLTKGISFNDSNNISIGGTQLFQNGLINPILIPSNLPTKTVSDFTNLSATGTIKSNNLITTGYSQASNTLYVGTGSKGYTDSPFKVDNIGDLTTSGKVVCSSVTATNLYGKLTGDVNGNVTGGVTGNVKGNVTGGVTGNVKGDVTGNVTGNVKGNLTGDVTGNLYGNVSGDVAGNLYGNVTGNVKGNVAGDVTGNLYGNVAGDVNGNLYGNVAGDVNGNLYGNVIGDVTGNLNGNVTGNVRGGIISGTTVSAANGLYTNATGSLTNGPSGGLNINGQNNWIIGENSIGELCFYNTTSGLENASNVPFVCISPTGYLVKGNA